jgi:hypothetical protein
MEIPLGTTISVLEKIDVSGGDKFRFVFNAPPYPIPFFELKNQLEENYGKLNTFTILEIYQNKDNYQINVIAEAQHGTPFILIFGVLVLGAGLLGWILKMQLQEVYKIIDAPVVKIVSPVLLLIGAVIGLTLLTKFFKRGK